MKHYRIWDGQKEYHAWLTDSQVVILRRQGCYVIEI